MAKSQTGMPPGEGWRRPASDTNILLTASARLQN